MVPKLYGRSKKINKNVDVFSFALIVQEVSYNSQISNIFCRHILIIGQASWNDTIYELKDSFNFHP